jgi:hypothetical protein
MAKQPQDASKNIKDVTTVKKEVSFAQLEQQHRSKPHSAPPASSKSEAEFQRSLSEEFSEASTSGINDEADGNGAIAIDTNPVSQVHTSQKHMTCVQFVAGN